MAVDMKTVVGWFAITAASTVVGIWYTNGYDWISAQFGSSPTIKFDFQASGGCPSGNLVDLKRHFDNQSVALEGGADRLVICSQNSLQTNSINAPSDIAHMFPGCLDYRADILRLMRASKAVCSHSRHNILVCDGQLGASSSGLEDLGSQSVDVPQCSPTTLSKFGFE
jgi:hypothetical protein